MEDINRIRMLLFKKKRTARWQACEVGVTPFNSQRLKGQKLTMPAEYLPNRDFLAYHRENVFVGA